MPSERAAHRKSPSRVIIVTGAAAGIGKAIAMALAETAEAVACVDLAPVDSEHLAALKARAGAAEYVCADVSSAASVADMVAAVLTRFGRIDVLVNNAGSVGAPGWESQEHPRPEDWDVAFKVNVYGSIQCMLAVAPAMKNQGGGQIVNVSSISGRQGRPMFRHYAATKAAVIQLTRSYAQLLKNDGIAVNAVCPGIVWTPMWERVGLAFARSDPAYAGLAAAEVYDRMVRERVPLQRGQTPESIAAVISYLASDQAGSITGEVLNVDGGIYVN